MAMTNHLGHFYFDAWFVSGHHLNGEVLYRTSVFGF